MTFYMRHDTHPRVGDLLYEVGWTSGGEPTHLSRTYEINDVIENRSDDGEIAFWMVSAKSRTINMAVQDILVRSIGPIRNYELVKA